MTANEKRSSDIIQRPQVTTDEFDTWEAVHGITEDAELNSGIYFALNSNPEIQKPEMNEHVIAKLALKMSQNCPYQARPCVTLTWTQLYTISMNP